MPQFDWNEEKNRTLKQERGVGFEDVVTAIHDDRLIDVEIIVSKEHKGQSTYIVEIERYAYVVPFVNDEQRGIIFLKTIFPSRKRTKKFITNTSK
jgi:uncharacterized DUF497 family protein